MSNNIQISLRVQADKEYLPSRKEVIKLLHLVLLNIEQGSNHAFICNKTGENVGEWYLDLPDEINSAQSKGITNA